MCVRVRQVNLVDRSFRAGFGIGASSKQSDSGDGDGDDQTMVEARTLASKLSPKRGKVYVVVAFARALSIWLPCSLFAERTLLQQRWHWQRRTATTEATKASPPSAAPPSGRELIACCCLAGCERAGRQAGCSLVCQVSRRLLILELLCAHAHKSSTDPKEMASCPRTARSCRRN